MRSFVLLIPALLAACGPRAASTSFAAAAEPPPSLAVDTPADNPFAPPRPLDAAPDPVRPASDGTTSVEVALLAPADVAPGVTQDDRAGVLAEVSRNAGLLQRCWEARADTVPAREGMVEIHAHIGTDGLIHGQCLGEGSLADEVVRSCANDLLAMGRYPAGDDNMDVTFQLRLRPPVR